MVIKVAVVGAGYFSQFQLQGWQNIIGVQVVAICDQNTSAAQALADRFGIKQVFGDAQTMLDAVEPELFDIITPPASHLALVRLAAQRKIPTICQKPLAPCLSEAREIVQTMEQAQTLLVVHENFRFSPWYREARRLIDSGQFGRLHSLAFRLRPGDGQGAQAYLDRQPYFQTLTRFLIHETAVHFIDTFRYLLGEVTAVTAKLRRLNPAISGEDAGYMLFEHVSGATSLFDGNRLNGHPADNLRLTMGEMWLEGEKGVLRLDGLANLYWQGHLGREQRHDYDHGTAGFAGGACENLQAHVIAHIRDGATVENRARDYLRNLVIEEAVYAASEQGRRITLTSE